MIFDECKMPDLSDLDFPLKKYLLLHAWGGDQGLTRKEGLYRRNFVRLVDKAIKEYQEARSAIIDQIEERKRPMEEMQKGTILYIFGFIDHFENCINALSRLLKQLDIIKAGLAGRPVPRGIRRSIEAHCRQIPDIRNIAEHMAEAIQNDELQDGQAVMICVGGDGEKAGVGGYEIRFDAVAVAIRRLHEVALELFNIERSDTVPRA